MNPKLYPALALLLLSAAAVSAVNSVLIPETLVITPDDVDLVEYCVTHHGDPLPDVAVVVEAVCRDRDHLVGCAPAEDEMSPASFGLAALDATTGPDGCATLQAVTASADVNGTYYYTVSGSLGHATITRETGTAVVPEFGTVAGALALGLSGLLIWRRQPHSKKEKKA